MVTSDKICINLYNMCFFTNANLVFRLIRIVYTHHSQSLPACAIYLISRIQLEKNIFVAN